MKTRTIIALYALSLLSCDQLMVVDNLRLKENINHIMYVKDKRTNLCFGGDWGTGITMFANVPCTPEVEKLLIK